MRRERLPFFFPFYRTRTMHYVFLMCILYTVQCATYNQYAATKKYPLYTTSSSVYKQFPYKSDDPSDIAHFPDGATQYPGYDAGYSNKYNNYNTGVNGVYYDSSGRSTQRYADGYSSYEFPFMKDERDYCVNRSPQLGIDMKELMGFWFGVEHIQHLGGDSRVDHSRTCIIIHIAEPVEQPSTENVLYHVQHINAKFRHEYRHLRLLWDEAGRTIEYSLYFRNDSVGYWQVFDAQNGTLTSFSTYQQFSGTIQVLKAVHDHLLLNFCQEPRDKRPAQLYSVLFSREPGFMERRDVESVHTLLQNKRLSVASRRMVCGNGGFRFEHDVLFIIFACIVTYIVNKY